MSLRGRSDNDSAQAEPSRPDWATAVLFHPDVGPIVHDKVEEVADLLRLRRTCRAAYHAIAFKPADARERLRTKGLGGLCGHAADRGDLRLLQWARARGCPWDEGTCSNAAGAGHLEVLKWAREKGCPWHERTCSDAACDGHLRCSWGARARLPVGRGDVR